MKRFITIALALVMLLSFVACSKANMEGTTWSGKIDVTDKMKELVASIGIADYLKDCVINVEVSFTKDEAKIKYDTTQMEASFRAALLQIPGVSEADVDSVMSGFIPQVRSNMKDMTQSYKLDGKKINIGGVEGTVSGNTMKLTFPELGEATFTKK